MRRNLSVILMLITALMQVTLWGAMSEQDCIAAALSHNLNISCKEETELAAEYDEKASFADFLPSLTGFGNYTYISEPIRYDLEEKFVDLMTGLQDFGDYLDAAHAEDPNWGAVEELYDPANSPFYNLLNEMYNAGLLDESLNMELGSENNWLFGVALTQPLFTGGKLYEKHKMSKNAREIASIEIEKTRQEVIYETMNRYWLVVKLEAKRELAQKYLETITQYESDIQNYVDEGIITSNDLLHIQVKKNEAELNLLKAENGIALSRMALNQIMGYELYKQVELSDKLPEKVSYQKDDSCQEKAMQMRPELKMLDRAIDISNSLKNIERSRYLPNIILNGSYTTVNPNPYNSLKEEFGDNWTVGITAEWEIFNWNQRGYSLAAAKHRKKALEMQQKEAEELVTLELQQAEFIAEESVAKVMMCRRNVNASEENLRMSEQRFTEGLIKTAEVLEAQTMWLQAGSEYIDSQVEYVMQQATVKKAAGILK